MTDPVPGELMGVNLAIDFDEARIIYRAVRDYQLKRVHEDSEDFQLCGGLLEALKPYYYTQQQEQPT